MKILLVEDDPLAGTLLSTMLSACRYTVDLATDGQQGFELADQLDYDLIVLDVQLPKLNGIQLCQQLRARGCSTPILMLTACDSSEDVIQGLDAGADDYVVKPYEPKQLAARVRSLLRRREKVLSSPVLQWGDLTLNPVSVEVTYQGKPVSMRPKEYSLLELFLRHPQRVFSRSAILDLLWQADDSLVEGTVTNLIKDLRRRLRSAGINQEVIETLYGLGYRLKALPTEGRPGSEMAEAGAPARGQTFPATVGANDTSEGQEGIQSSIAERFHNSLGGRLALLDMALQALQTQTLAPAQQQQAREEAHRLAGTLGLFGYSPIAEVVRQIEQLLELPDPGGVPEATLSQLRTAIQQLPAGSEAGLSEGLEPAEAEVSTPGIPGDWAPRWGSLVEGKVAVVDDDQLALEALKQVLQPWGFQVIGFTDSTLFWRQFPVLQPDLVLLDLQMPELGGIELCQRIRQHSTHGDVPILMVTAYTDETSIQQLFGAGADDFISKPVVGPELVTRVCSRLQQRTDHPGAASLPRSPIDPTPIDPLTQLPNRPSFEEKLWQNWQILLTAALPCALILANLNDFRGFNRRHGYRAGDACLQQVAQILQATIGPWPQEGYAPPPHLDSSQAACFSPLLARYRGDQFVLWLPGISPHATIQMAEGLLQALTQAPVSYGNALSSISLSLGITTMQPQANCSLDDLLTTAERALQLARNGDNPYCLLPCRQIAG